MMPTDLLHGCTPLPMLEKNSDSIAQHRRFDGIWRSYGPAWCDLMWAVQQHWCTFKNSLKMLSWNSSQKLVVNIFATEVVKKTTNAILLFQLFSCRLIFVVFYSLKFRAFLISFEFIHDHLRREKDDKFIVFYPPFSVSFQFFQL